VVWARSALQALAAFPEALPHHWRIAQAALVQRALPVAEAGFGPTRFGMA